MTRRGRASFRGWRLGVVAVSWALGVAVLLSACAPLSASGGPATSSVTVASPDGSEPAGLSRYYGQEVSWSSCGDKNAFECARVSVPLDYADPDGPSPISIALTVHRASKPSKGYLFVNPGGPGASGYSYVMTYLTELFSADLIANYDIVGFDPRGVGASTAVKCFASNSAKDEFLYGIVDGAEGSTAYVAASRAKFSAFGAECARLSGDLLAHVDTESAARDIDILRAAVGAQTIDYLGFSYGTLLGTTYAGLFPARVHRFVLDGAEDPSLSVTDVSYGQMLGFDGAIRAYVDDCLTQSSCPLSGPVDSALDQLYALVSGLESAPITNSDGRVLGEASMLQVILDCMYNTQYRTVLSNVIAQVKKGDAGSAFSVLDLFNSRSADGSYSDNSTEAFYAVMCLDYPRRTSPAEIEEDQRRYLASGARLAPFFADGTAMCDGWPDEPVRTPVAVAAAGSGPILIVGTTGDPATRYSWAQALAGQLENSRLLTVTAYQHTSYGATASSCVIGAVDGFLLDGAWPQAGTDCSP